MKKLNFVEAVYEFNKKAGLLDKPYSDFLESSFQIEEALEGFDLNSFEDCAIGFNPLDNPNAKEVSRMLVKIAMNSGNEEIEDVDRLDKACDAIVYALGSIAKLGLKPNDINEALDIVTTKNLEKLNCPKDEFGKLTKPEGFVGPEGELQAILTRIIDAKRLTTYKKVNIKLVDVEATTIMLNSTYGMAVVLVCNSDIDVSEYFLSMLEKDERVLSIEVI